MIEYRTGDILSTTDAQALVNPVNCVGVMGRGLALEFARRYPQMLHDYRQACHNGSIRPGITRLHTVEQNPARYVVSFPTKDQWSLPSKIEWIDQGMAHMMSLLVQHDIHSVAIPALGAGLGGLPWHLVQPIIVDHAQRHPDIHTIIITLPAAN